MIRYVDKYCPICGKQLASIDDGEVECLNGCKLPKEDTAINTKTIVYRLDALESKYNELEEQIRDLLEEVIDLKLEMQKKFESVNEQIAEKEMEGLQNVIKGFINKINKLYVQIRTRLHFHK